VLPFLFDIIYSYVILFIGRYNQRSGDFIMKKNKIYLLIALIGYFGGINAINFDGLKKHAFNAAPIGHAVAIQQALMLIKPEGQDLWLRKSAARGITFATNYHIHQDGFKDASLQLNHNMGVFFNQLGYIMVDACVAGGIHSLAKSFSMKNCFTPYISKENRKFITDQATVAISAGFLDLYPTFPAYSFFRCFTTTNAGNLSDYSQYKGEDNFSTVVAKHVVCESLKHVVLKPLVKTYVSENQAVGEIVSTLLAFGIVASTPAVMNGAASLFKS
jgi:hypothetical protein